MRTPALITFQKNVSELNKHLSHALFVFEQFSLDNDELILTKGEELTVNAYPNNQFSSQFNVKLNKIGVDASNSFDYIKDTFFVFINTSFEVYLLDMYNFVRNDLQSPLPEPPDSKIYLTVIRRLNIDLQTELDNLLVSTYDYYKLRRNATMHRDKSKRFQGAVEAMVRGERGREKESRPDQFNGTELNQNWEIYRQAHTKGHAVRHTNFRSTDLSKFSKDELIDVFNFYRLYAAAIDKLVIQNIDRDKLLKYVTLAYQDFYKGQTTTEFEKYSLRLRRVAKFSINLDITEDEIKDCYNDKYSDKGI